MLGVFDSGVGGRNALFRLRSLLPLSDIVFFADTAHAPYGGRSREELIPLIRRDMEILRAAGAGKILAACCTAGCVLETLPGVFPGVFPIVTPVARRAVTLTRRRTVGVLGTAATVKSGAFPRALRSLCPDVRTHAVAAPALVTLAENGITDPHDARVRAEMTRLRRAFRGFPMDTLVLGCTHFSSLGEALARAFPGVCQVSSADVGAECFADSLTEQERDGEGRTLFLNEKGDIVNHS